MTADISRYALRPAQGFTGVVRQQGRLPLDSDENEAGDLHALALRQAVAETICAAGSPDDGFRISDAAVALGALDFDIAAGSFYLQGVRVASPGLAYQEQPDWLTFRLDEPGPTIPGAGTSRRDLVWLEAWEQVVTAIEDAELYERALGGADTTARLRVIARVRVHEGVSDDCALAIDDLIATHFAGGSLAADRAEVLSDCRLTLDFVDLDTTDDLCQPEAQAGFLGARNETFRVQITMPGRFVWGRDNAAPLYRVQVASHPTDATRRRLVFLTPPRDGFGWPLAGMTVEVLRWGALLDNGEKVAEPTGLLLRVETGYDPAEGSITVTAEVPQAWDDWFATAAGLDTQSERDEDDVRRYFFLRLWTGGGVGSDPDRPFTAGTAVELGTTGLTLSFSDTGLPGDYWIVSARPNTPTLVTPWALLDGAPPVGPKRLIAPLALIPWSGSAPGTPIDCRHRFRPLCQVGGCCVVTVGDGRNSFGDVTSIQAALDRLPPAGGEVCLHPGTYSEHVTLDGVENLTITGCGRFTRWEGEPGNRNPLLEVRGVSGLRVRRLTMAAPQSEAILARGPEAGAKQTSRLVVEDVGFRVRERGAILADDVAGMRVRRCTLDLEPLDVTLSDDPEVGRQAAIYLSGSDLLVEGCRITGDAAIARQRLAVGGLHIGGPSERVIVRDNVIRGGNGPGITLGSVRLRKVEAEASEEGFLLSRIMVYVNEDGCITMTGTAPEPEDAEDDLVAESAGVLQDVRIIGNDILDTGGSGITSYVFAGLGADELGDAIVVEQLEIENNRITGCIRNEIGTVAPILRQVEGWGGIALSVCADGVIRDNLIACNGETATDPVSGIFVAVAEDLRIERNRIERNGGWASDEGAPLAPGRRDGITIGVAIGGVSTYGASADPERPSDRPALLVAGNTIDSPAGRALRAIALGPVMVQGNRLTGAGRSALFANVFASLAAFGAKAPLNREEVLRPRAEIDLGDYARLELLADLLGGDVVSLSNLGLIEELADLARLFTGLTPKDPEPWRGGETLVSNNQISLRRHSEQFGITVSAVMLLGGDDVAFVDNQAEIENDVVFALTNVLAVGATLRVTGNRLQKRLLGGILSAVTFGLLNQTALNQTTHCIFAVGFWAGRVVTGNRAVVSLLFPQLCQAIEGWADRISERLQTGYGKSGDNASFAED
ncbi:DUF6519 domain-containing protein [Thioalkalicoccus limnaeus]|uniref:DUF6519 domain-containing protein n=1 Tax=Thioalkalicoccus limnaeus TaxID=120681 RepID=A0ABV4BNQ8_9GAMM